MFPYIEGPCELGLMVQWLKRAAHNGCNVGSNPAKPKCGLLIRINFALNMPYKAVRARFINDEYKIPFVYAKRRLK